MLPAPVTSILFPLDVPAWTLLMELVANAAFAVSGLRTRQALLALTALSGLWLLAATAAGRGNAGGGLAGGWG